MRFLYNEVKTYRAYKEATSTSWKDPLVGLTYIDFDHQPTETEMSELVARYGGTWKLGKYVYYSQYCRRN